MGNQDKHKTREHKCTILVVHMQFRPRKAETGTAVHVQRHLGKYYTVEDRPSRSVRMYIRDFCGFVVLLYSGTWLRRANAGIEHAG